MANGVWIMAKVNPLSVLKIRGFLIWTSDVQTGIGCLFGLCYDMLII